MPAEIAGDGFASGGQFSWGSLAAQAGPGTVYDAMRGRTSELPAGGGASETCLASGSTTTQVMDATNPAAGTVFYYLVRGKNICGTGTYGTTTAGATRVTGACP